MWCRYRVRFHESPQKPFLDVPAMSGLHTQAELAAFYGVALQQAPGRTGSRRDTTLRKVAYLHQLPLSARPGTQAWTRHALQLRVAETAADRATAADIIRRRHYLGRWPVPPRTLMMTYLGALRGCDGTCALVTVAMLPGQYLAAQALGLHQCEVVQLVRMWRADDLGPEVAPNLTPEVLRRVIRGERNRGPLRDLATEWVARKGENLRARPRLLVTHADPAVGHDGAIYLAAGAVALGSAAGGKLRFAWGLDSAAKAELAAFAAAHRERNGHGHGL